MTSIDRGDQTVEVFWLNWMRVRRCGESEHHMPSLEQCLVPPNGSLMAPEEMLRKSSVVDGGVEFSLNNLIVRSIHTSQEVRGNASLESRLRKPRSSVPVEKVWSVRV